MDIWVLKWRTPKLILLDHVDQCRLQLEIIGIDGLVRNPKVVIIDYWLEIVFNYPLLVVLVSHCFSLNSPSRSYLSKSFLNSGL